MLERGILLVRDADSEGSRAIEDAVTGMAVGSARRAPQRPRWLPSRSVLEVREADDAPLVFTVRRGWSLLPRYEVCDAEGHPIGTLTGPVVAVCGGRCVAVLGPDGAFRSHQGSVLARMTRRPGGTEVGFTEALSVDPFGKMLLLAAVLRR